MSARPFVDRYGPWAVVTGASDGIGEQFAHRLAADGFDVVLVARRGDRLASLAHSLEQKHGIRCRTVVADLATVEGRDRAIAGAAGLDVGLLVAAAGFGTSGAFLAADPLREQEMLAVNCGAVLALAHAFGRTFAARGRGGLVLLSSIVAFQGVPRAAHYAATKAYVQSLAEGLRVELAPHGVDVIAAAPGPVRSGFAARADMRMGATVSPEAVARQTLAALGQRTVTRPGALSKLLGWSLATAPRALRVRILAAVMGGMTAHQRAPSVVGAEAERAR